MWLALDRNVLEEIENNTMIALFICYVLKKVLRDLTIWRSETRPVPAMASKIRPSFPPTYKPLTGS